MAGRKKRPSRLLNRWNTAPKKIFTKMNASLSPLLRLPPEVRNRIWRFALSSNTIHVKWRLDTGEPNDTLVYRLYEIPNDDIFYYERCGLDSATSYDGQHKNCNGYHSSRFGPAIPLLRVSRQIHHESALLPYSLITFAFHGDETFNTFMSSMLPSQKRALRSVIFSDALELRKPSDLSRLTGLSEVVIHALASGTPMKVCSYDILQRMERLPLSSVGCRMTVLKPAQFDAAAVRELEEKTRSVENKLFKSIVARRTSNSQAYVDR